MTADMTGMAAGDPEAKTSDEFVESILYRVPIGKVPIEQGRRVVLQTSDPIGLPAVLAGYTPGDVAWVELLEIPEQATDLVEWPEGLPIDISLADPAGDFPSLYRCAALIDRHPVRVSMPVVAGFGKAAKLATSLHFAVKLDVGQPDPSVIDELHQVLDLYLHQSTVGQPIEFFHSLLLAFLHDEPVSLWAVQEEDPTFYRSLTDAGVEGLNGRLRGTMLEGAPERYVDRFAKGRLDAKDECCGCSHFGYCGGYFKWPDPSYRCNGVESLLQAIRDAARDLAEDIASASANREMERPT